MNSIICSAIRSHNVIRFYCDGGYRTAEPFCHGASRAGNDLLRAYQTGGHSESGNPVKWKIFRVVKMSSITITDENFSGNRPDYYTNDSAMATVYCCV